MITCFRSLMAIAPALMLAACMTVAPHTVSQENIRNLKLVDVEISGLEVIRSWPAGEEAYARSPNADGNPGFATVFAVLQSLGIRLSALPAETELEQT